MTRNCLNVMRKVASMCKEAGPLPQLASLPVNPYTGNAGAAAAASYPNTGMYLSPFNRFMNNLGRMYRNPEEAAYNLQTALSRRQKDLEYLYNQGAKKLAPIVNREAGHVATRVAPALGQAGGSLVDAARDMYNTGADFAVKAGTGWGGELAENVGRHARTATETLRNDASKWDVAGATKAMDRSAKSFGKLGRTLLNRFQRGATR